MVGSDLFSPTVDSKASNLTSALGLVREGKVDCTVPIALTMERAFNVNTLPGFQNEPVWIVTGKPSLPPAHVNPLSVSDWKTWIVFLSLIAALVILKLVLRHNRFLRNSITVYKVVYYSTSLIIGVLLGWFASWLSVKFAQPRTFKNPADNLDMLADKLLSKEMTCYQVHQQSAVLDLVFNAPRRSSEMLKKFERVMKVNPPVMVNSFELVFEKLSGNPNACSLMLSVPLLEAVTCELYIVKDWSFITVPLTIYYRKDMEPPQNPVYLTKVMESMYGKVIQAQIQRSQAHLPNCERTTEHKIESLHLNQVYSVFLMLLSMSIVAIFIHLAPFLYLRNRRSFAFG